MPKLSDLSLDELYDRPKITPATLRAIKEKEDFSEIRPRYCDKVCAAPCYMKSPETVTLEPRPTDILIVHKHQAMDDGWKPGSSSDETHRRILNQLLSEEIGDKSVEHQTTFALKCQPLPENQAEREEAPFGKKPLPKNPKIKTTDVQKCSVYLMDEIKKIKPKVILTTSTDASKALGLSYTNYANRGYMEVIEVDGEEIPVVLTLHPEVTVMIRQNSSGQMWGPDFLDVIRRDVRKAVQIVTGEVTVKTLQEAFKRIEDQEQIVIPKNLDEVKYWVDIIAKFSGTRSLLSWDTETTGLDPWAEDARFLMHQFGFRRKDGEVQAVVFPLWHRDNTLYDPDEAWSLIKPLLEDKNLLKVAHNAAFDLKYTRVTTGVTVEGLVADTMLLVHAINSGIQGNYSLKTAVWDWLFNSGLGGYEEELDKEYQARMNAEADRLKELEKEEKAKEKAKEKAEAKKKAPAKKKAVARKKAVVKKTTVTVKTEKVVDEEVVESKTKTTSVEVVNPEPGSQQFPYAVRKKK